MTSTITEPSTSQLSISQLWIYPIKSLAGISLDSAQLEQRGLQHDRRWMLVDKNKHFLSQRTTPKMALIQVELSDFGLLLRATDMPALIVPYNDPQIGLYEELKVTCWNDYIIAQHINSAIDNWFSEFLGIDCQLVYMPESNERLVDPDYAPDNEITSFSDGFPNLLLSEASLADLNSRVKDIDLTIQRFRPNIVISGCTPYAEDTLGHFKIADINFYAVKPCARCVVTTINPDNANKESPEPLQTLAQFRKKKNKVLFGQNILHKLNRMHENILTIGDNIEIIQPSEALVFD